jgi:hypothetical protein
MPEVESGSGSGSGDRGRDLHADRRHRLNRSLLALAA